MSPTGSPRLPTLFDTWIDLLMATLPSVPVPTRTVACAVATTVETDGALPIKAESGLVWVSPRKAPRSYFGIDPTSVGADADCWPIAQNVWAHFEGEQFKVWHSAELLRATGGASFADGFYRFVVRVVSSRRAELANLRLSRDSLSRSTEQTLLADSLDQLAAVGRGERLAPEVGGANEFERAARLITRWLGVDVPRIVRPEGKTFSHMQLALSRTTGVRTRGVLLDKGWQKHNNGPLARLRDGRKRRARSGGALAISRRLFPCTIREAPRPQPIDDKTAAELHPHAHQVYAPLPSRPL